MNHEISNRWHISLFQEFGARFDKSPCAIFSGCILQTKLLPNTRFLINKGIAILILGRIFRDHPLSLDIHPNLIGTEIHYRQMHIVMVGKTTNKEIRPKRYKPIGLAGKAAYQMLVVTPQVASCRQQHNILEEGLPVGQQQRLPEATTIRYRIKQGQIERQRGHEAHHQQGQPCGITPIHTQKQSNA